MQLRFIVALTSVFALTGFELQAQTVLKSKFVGAYRWHNAQEQFGGFSGIELSEDGTDFVAITDRGFLTRGRIERTDGALGGVGAIENITMAPMASQLSTKGVALPRGWTDSEGLAQAKDGTLFVSFEGHHRVME